MNKTPLTSVEQLTKCNECNGSGRNKCPVTECPHSSHRCIGCDERGYDHIEPNDIEEDRNQAYTSLVEGIEGMTYAMNVDEYLELVEKWEGKNYDQPFDDGYAQALKDIRENVVNPLYGKK